MGWSGTPLATSTDTVYKNGFGPLTVTAAGSPYVAPVKGAIVPGFSGVSMTPTNAKLNFTLGNLNVEGKEFTQALTIANPSATGLTNTAIPYSSVFMELQPGYWDADSEQHLREKIQRDRMNKLARPIP